MNEETFKGLVAGYLDNSIDGEGMLALKVAIEDPAYEKMLGEMMDGQLAVGELNRTDFPETYQRIHDYVQANKEGAKFVAMPKRRWFKYAVAAALVGVIGTTYFIANNKWNTPTKLVAKADVKAPASNRATLTLTNGKTVYLDSVGNGQLAIQSGVELIKLADGKIAYSGKTTELQFNTLSNPKGSKAINVALPDGSQIWLDAGSSVTYPIAFVGQERRITMNGELYYEVAHDNKKPFIVQKGDMTVQVYGTHFNVKAYDNEPDIKVTLLEGSVSVTQNAKRQMLKPGQQAVVGQANIALVENADTEEALAWKNGKTSFHGTGIEAALRELERWYDISFEIKGQVPLRSLNSDLDRNEPLKDVLKTILDDNNVKYVFDANTRKLTVLQ